MLNSEKKKILTLALSEIFFLSETKNHNPLPWEILQGGTILLWGPVNRLRLLSKCKIWGPGYNVNVSEDQQPEFRSLSEIYIIIKQLYSEKNCWDLLIWVTGHCNRAAVSRNRYGVQLVNLHRNRKYFVIKLHT
jgi:hypothetical protein